MQPSRVLLAVVLSCALAAAANAAGVFTPSADAGLAKIPAGVTAALFPGPPCDAARAIAVYVVPPAPLEFDVVERISAPPVGSPAGTPDVVTWTTYRRSVRADDISGFLQGQDVYAPYVEVVLRTGARDDGFTIVADRIHVRGQKDFLERAWCQELGARLRNVTFDEK